LEHGAEIFYAGLYCTIKLRSARGTNDGRTAFSLILSMKLCRKVKDDLRLAVVAPDIHVPEVFNGQHQLPSMVNIIGINPSPFCMLVSVQTASDSTK
jgi:hypothetical protein